MFAVVGLIKVSRISTINYSVVAKDIEMDAILAVALGGNSLAGGKFNMAGSIMGAYTIQFLTTTLYKYNVPSEALPAYKAVVVIVLVVLSAPVVKERLGALGKKLSSKKNTAKRRSANMATSSKTAAAGKQAKKKVNISDQNLLLIINNCNFPCYVSRCHHFPWRRFPKRSELI